MAALMAAAKVRSERQNRSIRPERHSLDSFAERCVVLVIFFAKVFPGLSDLHHLSLTYYFCSLFAIILMNLF